MHHQHVYESGTYYIKNVLIAFNLNPFKKLPDSLLNIFYINASLHYFGLFGSGGC